MASENSKGGEWGESSVSEEVLAASSVSVAYVPVGAASTPAVETSPVGRVVIRLDPSTDLPAVPNAVKFTWMGNVYSDNGQGVLLRNADSAPPGIQSGTVDYSTCTAILDDWVVGPSPGSFTLSRLWVRRARWTSGVVYGRTASSPIRPGAGGFTLTATAINGDPVNATVDALGVISGDDVTGAMDFPSGAYQVMFGRLVLDSALSAEEKAEWWYDPAEVGTVEAGKVWRPLAVDPTSIRYNAVTYVYLPIDAELMGLTPERLPADGRMPFVRPGMYCTVGMTITGSAFTPANGMTISVGAILLSSIDVLDADGTGQVETGFTVDLDAGELVINDITGWPAQVIVRGRAEVYRVVANASIDGTVTLTLPVGRDFPAGSVLSTALRFGNRQAYVDRIFDQYTWDGVTWENQVDGTPATGSYASDANPVEVNNLGTVSQRWAIKFRNDGVNFDLIGESAGQIASGSINEDFSPANRQADNAPYFTLRAVGWGSGWVGGNVLFLHTVGPEMSHGVIRSTNPGSAAGTSYSALLAIRGDKDRPPSNPFN